MGKGHLRPIRLETEFAVRIGKALDVMRLVKRWLDIAEIVFRQILKTAPAGILQGPVDDLALAHGKAGMLGPHRTGNGTDHLMVGAAFSRWVHGLQSQLDMLVATCGIKVIMLKEHGRRQNKVGHLRRIGHELLMHHGEQVIALKTPPHQFLIRADIHRIGVLDQHGCHRRPLTAIGTTQGGCVSRQDRANTGLVEHADGGVSHIQPLDHRLVPVIDGPIIVERATALMLVAARHHRNTARRMHADRAIALAAKAIAKAEKGLLRLADKGGKGLDLLNRQAGNG